MNYIIVREHKSSKGKTCTNTIPKDRTWIETFEEVKEYNARLAKLQHAKTLSAHDAYEKAFPTLYDYIKYGSQGQKDKAQAELNKQTLLTHDQYIAKLNKPEESVCVQVTFKELIIVNGKTYKQIHHKEFTRIDAYKDWFKKHIASWTHFKSDINEDFIKVISFTGFRRYKDTVVTPKLVVKG